MSGLLLGMDLSFCTCWFNTMVILPSKLLLTDLVCGHSSVHYLILLLFPCISLSVPEHALYHVSLCIVLLPIIGMLTWCVILSIVCWPFITSLSRSVCKESPNLAYTCWMLSFVVSLFSFDWFNSSTTLAAILLLNSHLVYYFHDC